LDKLVEVMGIRMEGNTLKVLVGEAKNGDPTEILSVVAKATLLNVSAAGMKPISSNSFGHLSVKPDRLHSFNLSTLMHFTSPPVVRLVITSGNAMNKRVLPMKLRSFLNLSLNKSKIV
jgi:hypothetical protein